MPALSLPAVSLVTVSLLSGLLFGPAASSSGEESGEKSTTGGWQALTTFWHSNKKETEANPGKVSPTVPESLIVTEPNPVLPGQTVTFHMPTGVARVVASGGGFGHETDVTDRPLITDTPKQTTHYAFTLWFDNKTMAKAAGKPAGKMARKPTPQKTLKQAVQVHVYEGTFPAIATYRDPRHWRVDCIAGWNRYVTPEADPANNALIFFQSQEDNPERIAVAIVPVGKMTSEELMHQVLIDAPTQYDVLQDVHQKPTTQGGLPAAWATFKGMDRALPGTATISMILTFVKDGRGYVISGRTSESKFAERERLLRCLVRSFALEPAGTLEAKAQKKERTERPQEKGVRQAAQQRASVR